jgi:hypothetical protein
VNISSCFLQFFVLPKILSSGSLPQVLANIPILLFITTMTVYLWPTLLGVMIAFGSMKVIEYSVMTAAMEMIYMPMDKDVRYLGKELVKFFGHKLGKSGSSIVLSTISATFKPSLSVQSGLTFLTTWFWAFSMYILSIHLQNRDMNAAKDKFPMSSVSELNLSEDDGGTDSNNSTPVTVSYSPSVQQFSDQDVGLSLEEDETISTIPVSNSNETLCCAPRNIVYGIASIENNPKTANTHDEADKRVVEGLRRRRSSHKQARAQAATVDASTSDMQPSAYSMFLSLFSPQKTNKRNTMLRIGSEAVALTTLMEKQERRNNNGDE